YWKDKHTPVDIYGYYPFSSPDDVNAYSFSVSTNQARTYDNGKMGDYEASDFLWGKIGGAEPTTSTIRLPLMHKMSNARVTLVEGSGFDDGEWHKVSKQVLVTNTIQDCTIDLSTGVVTNVGHVSPNAIIPAQKGDEWRAIVVPQTIPASTTLFSITIDGIPYKFSKTESMTYIAGKMNNFSIRVDKKLNTGDYALTLIGESITPWENDLVSHDASAREYIVVNSTPGGLKDAMVAANLNYATIQNLKVTGQIDQRDFEFMNKQMSRLQALNLKEVKIVKYGNYEADQIPSRAFQNNKFLNIIILPEKLTSIGASAFENCVLTGSLSIPEGVIEIGVSAFKSCNTLTGTLVLPSTLKSIGNNAFQQCLFTCQLNLPEGLEYIGSSAFHYCYNLYGNLILPQSLNYLGGSCFNDCRHLSGDLVIPQNITKILSDSFAFTPFNGNLHLHDGIILIEREAFYNCNFKGELVLPKNLTIISSKAFGCNRFSGNLVLPKNVLTIGTSAFWGNKFAGILEFPEGLVNIGEEAFSRCSDLEGLILPKSLETIGNDAFGRCFGLGSIVSNSTIPPTIQSNTFDGVPKDNFTLEVPETALAQYQTTAGWREFKRIAPHHLLLCRPASVCALSTQHKQTLIIDAEGEWEVMSKPSWCELSQTSGNKKTEVTLTIKATSKFSSGREGDIVFCLKEDDYYTHSCHVNQYGFDYDEDEFITLQRATKGNNGGINIVILGDGYDAKDIAEGNYLADMNQQIEHFFSIEPYTTYRDYFNVYTAIPLSNESGVGSVNTIRNNRFNTTFTGGVGLSCDETEVFNYVLKAPTVNTNNLDQTLVILVPNSTEYGGICKMWESGATIAICPKSTNDYPYDSRGIVQHEAGGHGFGKLADEYIYHNAFISECKCFDCKHDDAVRHAKSLGWYDNIELHGKIHQVGWSHLIFDPRYSDIVDVFEGGFMHSRGVFRSEQTSCMNNNIPYYSTISRESIVRRIKKYAGETYSFEEFVANDKRGAATRSSGYESAASPKRQSFAPVIHKGKPKLKLR
ncbi:MAG: leucine-rich repeat protein, partial [Muribaculaceae bacterium]|nr:leucine-rich repeat protein [Muribaculaceae bacterium]